MPLLPPPPAGSGGLLWEGPFSKNSAYCSRRQETSESRRLKIRAQRDVIGRRNVTIAGLNDRIVAIQAFQVVEMATAVAGWNQRAAHKDRALKNRRNQVKRLDRRIRGLTTANQASVLLINNLQAEILQKDAELVAKDNTITDLQKAVADQSTEIAELRTAVDTKDMRIGQLEEDVVIQKKVAAIRKRKFGDGSSSDSEDE